MVTSPRVMVCLYHDKVHNDSGGDKWWLRLSKPPLSDWIFIADVPELVNEGVLKGKALLDECFGVNSFGNGVMCRILCLSGFVLYS